eukprot:scaffold56224_cov63-Phaeocystis_antarctica.AAC.2
MRCASCARDYAHGAELRACGPQLPCLLAMAAASLPRPFPALDGGRAPVTRVDRVRSPETPSSSSSSWTGASPAFSWWRADPCSVGRGPDWSGIAAAACRQLRWSRGLVMPEAPRFALETGS